MTFDSRALCRLGISRLWKLRRSQVPLRMLPGRDNDTLQRIDNLAIWLCMVHALRALVYESRWF
ncbi:MAG: hypothetical protein VYA30_02060 [Myxococcota bacterium]|nr:hypothetical protein [Myxococcota bacterium]